MSTLYERVCEAARKIQTVIDDEPPRAGIILGTGLGGLAGDIEDARELPYSDVPHFAVSTVETHASRVVYGKLAGTPVLALDGRFHLYEGWTLEQITLPVRVLKQLGCGVLVVSGASGGMNPQHELGDIVIIEDQINFMGVNPLIGPNDELLGPRWPDMVEPYSKRLISAASRAALEEGIRAHTGVYVGVTGPNLETRAEYRMLRAMGADVVGMSIVPEVIVAVHAGLEVLGMAVVTDRCLPDALGPANIQEIIATAQAAEPKLCAIVKKVIAGL